MTSSSPKSRLRVGFAVVAIAVVAFSLTAVTAPSGAEQTAVVTGTVTVEADATVSSLRPDTPLGDEPWLRADLLPERHAFLRFALPETDGTLTAATLRVWVRDDSGGFGVASVLGAWDESTVTMSTAPPVGPAFAQVGPSVEATWVQIPVPAELLGRGSISLALVGASEQKSELASREAQRPPLLDYTLTPPDPGGSPGVTGSTGATGPGATGPVATGPTAAPSIPESPSPTDVPAPTEAPTATPSTAPSQPVPPTNDPTVVAAGDIACAPGSSSFNGGTGTADECHMLATSDLIGRLAPTAVLALGDEQYEVGALAAFETSYGPTWGRHLAKTYPVPGNHEYDTRGAAGYYAYFGDRAGDPATGYYSFDLGAWHLVALNSNCAAIGGCDEGSPQVAWLRQDLAADDASCTLAFWHHPRFSSGSEHGNDAAMQTFWNVLYADGADVVLNGHEHDYERFAEQSPGRVADPDGIREFVVGTGGKSLHPIVALQPNSEAHADDVFGVLELTLHPSGYGWRFVGEDGSIHDEGSSTCSS